MADIACVPWRTLAGDGGTGIVPPRAELTEDAAGPPTRGPPPAAGGMFGGGAMRPRGTIATASGSLSARTFLGI